MAPPPAPRTSLTLDEQRARDALAFDPLPTSPWISTHAELGIIIAVRYSEPLSRLLRDLPGGKWDPINRRWIYLYTSAENIRSKIHEINRLAAAAHEVSEKETKRQVTAQAEATKRRENEARKLEEQRRKCHPRLLRPEFLTAVDGPLYHLALEAIADNETRPGLLFGIRSRAWVAQIMGVDGRENFLRAHIHGNRDYLKSNSIGSRGIYINFQLRQGPIYEVSSPKSWRQTDRYFLRVVDGCSRQMTAQEVAECLEK